MAAGTRRLASLYERELAALEEAGWGVAEGSRVLRGYPITPGRIERPAALDPFVLRPGVG